MSERQVFNLSAVKEKFSKFVSSLPRKKQPITQAEKPEDLLDEVDLTKTNIVTKTEGRVFRGPFGN
ncbi:MAG: hypothetical protein ACD_19C00432G0016 [uncultured bacterium]|nr:MAG: hypothetical protein ACD_19C00432G0016 [uncultured bacterium]